MKKDTDMIMDGKPLDIEDIESLGFKLEKVKVKRHFDTFIYKPNDHVQYNLVYVYELKLLRISIEDLVYFEEHINYVFQGIVNNISELKIILKQVIKDETNNSKN